MEAASKRNNKADPSDVSLTGSALLSAMRMKNKVLIFVRM